MYGTQVTSEIQANTFNDNRMRKNLQKFQLNTMLNNPRMAGEQRANRTFCGFEERKMCANEQRTNEKANREKNEIFFLLNRHFCHERKPLMFYFCPKSCEYNTKVEKAISSQLNALR